MNLAGLEDVGINTLCQDDAGTSVSQAEVKILLFKLRAASCITNKEHIVVFQTYLVQFFNQADEKGFSMSYINTAMVLLVLEKIFLTGWFGI